jgi:ABC-type sugar transport system permease subunit
VSVRLGRRRRREALLAYALILPSLLVFAVFVFYPFLRNFWLAMYATPPFPGMPRQRVGFRQYRRVLDLGTMGHAFVTVLPWAVAIGVLAAVAGIVVARRRGVAGAARRFAVWALAAEVVLGLWRFTVDSGSDFANSFRVTVVFAILTVPAGIALGLGLAVLAHQRLAGIAVYRTIFSSTVATSVAVASVIFGTLLNPQVGLLPWIGLRASPSILDNPRWALYAVAVTTIWQNLGLTFILMSAGLQAVPDELLEAAQVDGAHPWTRFRRVTLPLLSPTIFFAFVVGGIFAFQTFGQIDLLTNGGPVKKTNVLTYSIYTTLRAQQDEGRAAVLAIALFAVTLGLTLVQLRLLERRVTYAR